MRCVMIDKRVKYAIVHLCREYVIYSVYKNVSNLFFYLIVINFLLLFATNNDFKFYSSFLILFLCCVYYFGNFKVKSQKAGEQAIRYVNLLNSGYIPDTTLSDSLQKIYKSNSPIPYGLFKSIYLFSIILLKAEPSFIEKAKGELTLYEKFMLCLVGGLPRNDVIMRIYSNSIHYEIFL